jgi:hypothetical protein
MIMSGDRSSLRFSDRQLTRPWARYVRRRCLGAWLTWMCLTIRLLVSRPLVSALASAFLRSERRNSALLAGQRALETPKALPLGSESVSACNNAICSYYFSSFPPGIPISVCILAHGYRQHPFSRGLHVPWAVRPVLPAYLLIGTASTWPLTFSRYWRARVTFQPLMAWAVSRVFLKETRR